MIYTLKLNNQVALVNSHGGELFSYCRNGKEYLWNGDPAFWKGHAPILFPVIGQPGKGEYRYKGIAYPMTKHGFLRDLEAQLVSEDDSSITLQFTETSYTLGMYPFEFCVQVKHTLLESGFETAYTVINTGNQELPFTLGGHPGIRCPWNEDEVMDDYYLEFSEDISMQSLRYHEGKPYSRSDTYSVSSSPRVLNLSHSLFDHDALIFDEVQSRSVALKNRGSKMYLEFGYSYPVLAIWSMPHTQAPYLCLEPWLGLPWLDSDTDSLQSKPYCVTLLPKQSHTEMYHLNLREVD